MNQIREWMMLCEAVLYEDTRTYLADLVRTDQRQRNQFKTYVEKYPSWEEGTRAWVKQFNVAPDDVFGEKAKLSHFVQQAPSFQYDTFDENDWNNFWLLSQHCDFNRAFQGVALKTIQRYEGTNNDHYRYLADRISCGANGTQRYNTQDGCEVDA